MQVAATAGQVPFVVNSYTELFFLLQRSRTLFSPFELDAYAHARSYLDRAGAVPSTPIKSSITLKPFGLSVSCFRCNTGKIGHIVAKKLILGSSSPHVEAKYVRPSCSVIYLSSNEYKKLKLRNNHIHISLWRVYICIYFLCKITCASLASCPPATTLRFGERV